MPSLNELSGTEIREKLLTQEITSEEVVLACFDRIEKVEEKIHAYTVLYKDEALKAAKEADKQLKSKKVKGNLLGIPIAIKDLISVKGHQTSASSKMLEGYIAPYDATVIKRLVRDQGAIVSGVGKIHGF